MATIGALLLMSASAFGMPSLAQVETPDVALARSLARDGVAFPTHLRDESWSPATAPASAPGGLLAAPPLQDEKIGRPLPPRDDDELVINLGAHLRFSIPFGAADREYTAYGYGWYVVDHYLSWADFFNPGWGFELEADIFFNKNGPGRRRTPGFNYGVCLLFQADQYYGRRIDGDFGGSVRVDDMMTTAIQVGGRVMQTVGTDFWYGGLITLGAVHYSDVEGTFNGPLFPSKDFRDRVLSDTWTIASDMRADAGYRLGPLGLSIGAGLRIMGPPNEGPNFSMNSGAFWTFDLHVGAEIGF